MTTTAATNPKCVACRADTSEGHGPANRRPFLTDEGVVRYMCGGCYSAAPIDRLRGTRWLPAHPSNQPPPPPRQAPSRRRTDVHVQGACTMCGVAVDDEWPEIHHTFAGVAILGPRCAPCDGGITACDYDAVLFLASVHNRQDLTEHDFYAGIVAWHAKEGLRPPPPAEAPWQF